MASYEDLMMQFYGNLGTAGQKFTSDILKPYISGEKTFGPPLKEVSGPTGIQQSYFQQFQNMQMPDYFKTGVGALEGAEKMANTAVTQATSATQEYDPQSYKKFMDPYQKEVVDAYTKEMQRQFDISRQSRAAQAQSAGAFGGEREGVVETEAQRGFQDTLGRGIAGLMSQGYGQAQTLGLKGFESQMGRTLDASKIGLGGAGIGRDVGTTYGQYGLGAPSAFQTYMDTMGKAGAAQYGLAQAPKDAAYEQASLAYQLPFQAFNLQSGIVSGFPSPAQFYPQGQQGGINPLMALFS